MKKLVLLFAMVLFYAVPVFSQKPVESQSVPELQEWWRAPANEKGLGRFGVSHIPNFYNGKDAMGVSLNNGQMETWLNRFPGDRENIFTWKGGGPVLQGDFNGDGITDYLGGAIVYRGIQNGEPPDSIPVQTLTISPDIIVDVNHDGYDDIVEWYEGGGRRYGGSIGRVAYGAADFKDMKVVSFQCDISMDSTMEMERMYMGADGDMRIIMYNHTLLNDSQRQFSGYGLFRAKWKTGDTLPTYEKLSIIFRYKDQGADFDRSGKVYKSKFSTIPYYIATEVVGTQWNIIIYNLLSDKFEETKKMQFTTATTALPRMLHGSINGDKYENWILVRRDQKYEFYNGGDVLDTTKFAIYNSSSCPVDILETIGDVNGDSINDLAVSLSANGIPNCFRIVLGRKSTNGVFETTTPKDNIFTLTETTPHPLIRGKVATLSIDIKKNGTYLLELFDISGKPVAELKRQYLEQGNQNIVIDISHFPIVTGTYQLRLRSEMGMIIGQRTIIIE